MLDLGCGIGHSYHLLAPRETVGLDISADALRGQERTTVGGRHAGDPVRAGDFASVLSVQSLEHVRDPERVVAEVARVLGPKGTAMFVTPNRLTLGRPDEIIDPYHFREFDHAELEALCLQHFERVRVVGLVRLAARTWRSCNEERAKLDRLLAKDPLRLRRLVPIRVKQWLYDAMLSSPPGQARPSCRGHRGGRLRAARHAICSRRSTSARCASRPGPDAEPGRRQPASGAASPSTTAPPTCTGGRGVRAAAPPPRTRRPPPRSSPEAYGEWYRPPAERRFYFAADAILGRTRGVLAARIDAVAPPGPVLDVGAGEGSLVDALRARGREATGPRAGPVRDDFLDESLPEVEGEWAAVVFWHSLEHLPDPGDAIRHAARLLEPGGVTVIAVPNTDSFQAEAFGDRWLHLDFPRHLVHLSSGCLRQRPPEGGVRDRARVVRSVRADPDRLAPGDRRPAARTPRPLPRAPPGAGPRRPPVGAQAVARDRRRRAARPRSPRSLAGAEIIARRAGTVYIEARRP